MSKVIAILILSGAPAGAEIPKKEDAEHFERRLRQILTEKFKGFTDPQRDRFAAGVRASLEKHPETFDRTWLDAFLDAYAKAGPWVVVAIKRKRWDEECDLEFAITERKIEVYIEKLRLTEPERAAIGRQSAALLAENEKRVRRWFEGLDAGEFRGLYKTRGAPYAHPIDETLEWVREGWKAVMDSPFHNTFRRPLTEYEFARAPRRWEDLIRKLIERDNLSQDVARWKSALEAAAKEEDESARRNAHQRVLGELIQTLENFRYLILTIVRGEMEPPPSPAEKKARAAIREREAAEKK